MSATTAAPRKGRPRDEDVDRRITAAALEVLADHGAEGFSVAEVALRSGVAKTSIYRRYPSRDDLVIGALERLNDDLPTLPARGSVRDRLVELLGGIRRRSPAGLHGRLMMQVAATSDPRLAHLVFERVVRPRQAVLRAVLSEGMATGEIRRDLDVEAWIPLLVGPMLYLRMWHAVPQVTRLTVDDLVDELMRGLTPATGS
jgi:AcrR family transcriptional regulator